MGSREKEVTKVIPRFLVGRARWTVVLFTEAGIMGRGLDSGGTIVGLEGMTGLLLVLHKSVSQRKEWWWTLQSQMY